MGQTLSSSDIPDVVTVTTRCHSFVSADASNPCGIATLPQDLLRLVILHLDDIRDFGRLSSSCRYFYSLFHGSQSIWKQHFVALSEEANRSQERWESSPKPGPYYRDCRAHTVPEETPEEGWMSHCLTCYYGERPSVKAWNNDQHVMNLLRRRGAKRMAAKYQLRPRAGLLQIPGVKEPVRIVMLGLDAAGKTTIMYKIRCGEVVTTIPTIGFNVESAVQGAVQLTCWDIGGPDKIRPLWRHYFQDVVATIFVVDSNDRERMASKYGSGARGELEGLLRDLPSNIILVFANKSDLPSAMSPAEIEEQLGLKEYRHLTYTVQPCIATIGEGLSEGFAWLHQQIAKMIG